MKRVISMLISHHKLPQGYELKASDVGALLDFHGFGHVLTNDVGKRVWVKSYGFVMENGEQRDKRKGQNNPRRKYKRSRRNCGCRKNPSKRFQSKGFKAYYKRMTRAERSRLAKMTTPYYSKRLKRKKAPSMYLKSGKPTAWAEMVYGWYKGGK